MKSNTPKADIELVLNKSTNGLRNFKTKSYKFKNWSSETTMSVHPEIAKRRRVV